VKTEVLGLPVTAIVIGVCDTNGERACGWGSYLAIVTPIPFEDARKQLKNRTGIDYTKEKRDAEAGVTLQPVLSGSRSGNETALICDPGLL
jgi:hypothetical protein